MTEAFFEKFTQLIFGIIMIILLFLSTIMVLLAYAFTQNTIFYYCYIGALTFSFYYAIQYFRQFKNFKENLNLFIPNSNNEKPVEPLNMNLEDRALKVCLYYRNGATYEQIQRDLGLTHPNQVKRELQKGLSFLLRFYNENRDRNECER